LPPDQQIGGYPTVSQYTDTTLDAAAIDAEGRCMILEFPAFVLIGTYCPANSDGTRDEFRISFLNALDARIRNLYALGKRVVLAGDLNIIAKEIDTASAQERMRKDGITAEEFFSTPARRMLNHLIVEGQVYGERDEDRREPVLHDLCRMFHPNRKGMFTCWETKKNYRPANYGSRIDYICASTGTTDWWEDANIQEGLLGSDHCPVYATLKDRVVLEGSEINILDAMNPHGMFKGGERLREWSAKDLLPLSAKLIPEFDRRRSIRDMFMKKSPLPSSKNSGSTPLIGVDSQQILNKNQQASLMHTSAVSTPNDPPQVSSPSPSFNEAQRANPVPVKRSSEASGERSFKRSKSGSNGKHQQSTLKGQSSLKGFFKPKTTSTSSGEPSDSDAHVATRDMETAEFKTTTKHLQSSDPKETFEGDRAVETQPVDPRDGHEVVDPIVSKESWSKLLGKRKVPRCEHEEPCISMVTKKPGVNCGRSFFICARPYGPSGEKEKGTQWRCGTFIWSSDWTGDAVTR
jgi:AP endonuclease-2